MRKFPTIKNKRAISPVIATVILVAVAITISVAVAYWMGGIAGGYTKFEKVEIQSAVCTLYSSGNWTVQMRLKNTGTASATLISAYINDIGVDVYDAADSGYTFTANQWATNMTQATSITSGQTITVNFYITADRLGSTLSSGTTVNIRIHSAGGMDYPKLVELV